MRTSTTRRGTGLNSTRSSRTRRKSRSRRRNTGGILPPRLPEQDKGVRDPDRRAGRGDDGREGLVAKLNPSLYKVIYSSLSTLTVTEFYQNLVTQMGGIPAYQKSKNFRLIQEEILRLSAEKKADPGDHHRRGELHFRRDPERHEDPL